MKAADKNSKSRLTAILCGLFVLSAFSIARAGDDIYWINPDGGDFSDAANWDPAQVPGPDDTAWFNIAPPDHYTVTWSEPITNKNVLVQQGNITWDFGGQTYSLNNVERSIFGQAGNTLDLTIQNGAVDFKNAVPQYYQIEGNTTVRIAPDITGYIGRYSPGIHSGSRLIVDGAEVTAGRTTILSGGMLIVTNGGSLDAGSNNMNIEAGGKVHVSGDGSHLRSPPARSGGKLNGELYVGQGARAQIWGVNEPSYIDEGLLLLDHGAVSTIGWSEIINEQGFIEGHGSITGSVRNAGGRIRPGRSDEIGLLTHTGDFYNYNPDTPSESGVIEIELAGAGENDLFVVDGAFHAAGTLDIKLINGFRPVNDDVFVIFEFGSMEGEFDTINLPGDPKHWNLSKLYTEGEISFYRPHGTIFSVR